MKYKFADGVSVSRLGDSFLIQRQDQILSLDRESLAHWSIVDLMSSGKTLELDESNQNALAELEHFGLISSHNQDSNANPAKVFFVYEPDVPVSAYENAIEIVSDKEQADLLVLSQLHNSQDERIEFSEFLMEKKCPGLISYVDGFRFRIGPFVVPGQTACENCLVHRSAAWAETPDLLASINNPLASSLPDSNTAKIMLTLVTAQIINFHKNALVGCLHNKVLFGSTNRFAFDIHNVHQFPFCRICSHEG